MLYHIDNSPSLRDIFLEICDYIVLSYALFQIKYRMIIETIIFEILMVCFE